MHPCTTWRGLTRLQKGRVKTYPTVELLTKAVRLMSMSLKSTLLDLFVIDQPVHRRALSHHSDYDSLSRALGQLVRDGALVRTGRGEFMRPGSHYVPKEPDALVELVEKRIRECGRNVFIRKDFRDLGKDHAVGAALRKLVLCGKLVRIGRGLYAKSAIDPKEGFPMPHVALETLAVEALLLLGKKIVEPDCTPRGARASSLSAAANKPILIENVVSLRIGYRGRFVHIERSAKATLKHGRP